LLSISIGDQLPILCGFISLFLMEKFTDLFRRKALESIFNLSKCSKLRRGEYRDIGSIADIDFTYIITIHLFFNSNLFLPFQKRREPGLKFLWNWAMKGMGIMRSSD